MKLKDLIPTVTYRLKDNWILHMSYDGGQWIASIEGYKPVTLREMEFSAIDAESLIAQIKSNPVNT